MVILSKCVLDIRHCVLILKLDIRHCVLILNFLFILTFYLQCFVHFEIISDLQNCYRNRTITKHQLPRFHKC